MSAEPSGDLALAVRMARRELRGGLKGFRIFIACLAIGVAPIAGIGSLSQSITEGLSANARTLLGGDISLRTQHIPLDARQQSYLAENTVAVARTVEMRAMARPAGTAGRTALIELKAVDGLYPMAGTITLDPPLSLSDALKKRGGIRGAAVDGNLLDKLGVALGDTIGVGETEFQIRARVVREPDRVATVLSFGPRFLIAMDALDDTQLVRQGSQIHFFYRIHLPENLSGKVWTERLKAAFPDAPWRIQGLDNAAPGIQRFIERMTLFLNFVGLTALLVGGIGVTGAIGSYLDGRTKTIATLKCLGAPARTIFQIYFLQVLALSGIGIGIGLLVGAVAPVLVAIALKGLLPFDLHVGLYPGSLLLAALFGLLTSLTFAYWPLARARGVPAATLFRATIAPHHWQGEPRTYAIMGLGVAALAALTMLSASDRYFSFWFIGGSITAILALKGGGALLGAGAARLNAGGPLLRLVLANLHRPGAATSGIVMALGLGLSVLIAVALIEGNLSRQISDRLPEQAPAFFFLDIQPGQVADFDATVNAIKGTSGLQRVPSLRGRIVLINGTPVEKAVIAPGVQWAVRGDRALTYAAVATKHTKITAGKWWPEDYAGPPLISFDAGVARGFGIGVGDTLTFNVLGRKITATIASLREIDWRSLRFDFAVIFAPGTLEVAPHTFIGAVNAPGNIENAVEKAITDKFSNISAIRVREALEAAAGILGGIGWAVRSTSLITIIAGAVVLAGAIAAARQRRIYESVVFKVLGATRRDVLHAFLLEYGILGLATGIIAACVGTLTGWAVTVFLMHSPWTFLPGVVASVIAGCIFVTVLVGFAGTWQALGAKAAPYLRNH